MFLVRPSTARFNKKSPLTNINIDEELTPTPQEEYQLLIQHPIFQYQKNDNELSLIIKALEQIIRPEPNLSAIKNLKYKEHLYNLIFEKKALSELQQSKQLNIIQKTMCGKHVAHGDFYFRCLDCDLNTIPGIVALFCVECFEKANHADHRVLLVKKENQSTATCDCGDPDAFTPEGFCSDHQQQDIDLQEFLKRFPSILFERYQLVLRKAFYAVISLYEISQITKGNNAKSLIITLADQCLDDLLSFCELSFEEISESFLVILSNIYKAPFLDPYNASWHNCQNLKTSSHHPTKKEDCKCSILGNLFKFGMIMGKRQQSKLEKIVTNCARDPHFKEFMAIEMAKFAYFLFTKDLTDQDRNSLSHESPNSCLLRMITQVYQKEEVMMKVLDKGYLDHYVEIFEQVINDATQINFTVSYISTESLSAIDLFLDERLATSQILLRKGEILSWLLKIYAHFEAKFLYDPEIHIGLYPHNVDYFKINFGLINERSMRRVVLDGLKQIFVQKGKYSTAEKSSILSKLLQDLYSNYQNQISNVETSINPKESRFNLSMERIFTSLMINHLDYPIDIEDLKTKFQAVDLQNLSAQFIESTLKSFGKLRYITLVHNFDGGMIWGVYYDISGSMFELDIVQIQLLNSFITTPEQDLFTLTAQSFFSYSEELQKFFTDPSKSLISDDYLKQKITVLEDFLSFLIFIMNDELSLVNLQYTKKEQLKDQFQLDSRVPQVVERILTNILVGLYWTNINQLKNVLETMFRSQTHVDELIKKLTIINEKDHKIRIKDEFLTEFDSYLLYKSPSFNQELLSSLSSKTQVTQKIDLVSGKYYSDLPNHLKQTQKNFYQSSLPNFLALFIQEFNKDTTQLVRPVLKLILLNLQVFQDALTKEDNDQTQLLKKRVEENYFQEKFTDALTSLSEKPEFKDCQECLSKIQRLIKTLSLSSVNEETLNEEDLQEKKRIEAEEKKR